MRPRVLIICDREVERDTIRVLVGTMGCQWVVASDLKEALGILNRETTSVAILDSRCNVKDPETEDQHVREILMRLPGRVIVLTDEPIGAGTNDLVRKYSLPFVQRDRLTQDLWGLMERLMQPDRSYLQIREVAKLILDSFVQPLPAGVRYSPGDERHLIYEAESLVVDLSIEPLPEVNRISMLGQVLRKDKPDLPLEGITVMLQGQKGPLELGVTNTFGEFSFEIAKEPSVTLEIGDRPNHCVTVNSPNLHWDFGYEAAGGDLPGRDNSKGKSKHDPSKSKGK